jgi:hypothetical protein
MIRKTKKGYVVYSEKTSRRLGGPYKTRAEALRRLRQVEYFKHKKGPHSPTTWAYAEVGLKKLISS